MTQYIGLPSTSTSCLCVLVFIVTFGTNGMFICSMFLDAKWNRSMVWSFIKQSFEKVKHEGPAFGILVVGEIGAGKSTLINNLLGQDVVPISSTLERGTSDIFKYSLALEGVPLTLYDTPGLYYDSDDDSHLQKVKAVLDKGYIHLVIYCIKMSDLRLHSYIIQNFQEYHKIGVKWEHTVIALTFADCVPVSRERRIKTGFNMASYFNNQLAKWCACITETLVERVGVAPEVAKKVKYYPTISDRDGMLPNGEQWFVPFSLGILEMLSPGATMQQSNCVGRNSAENVTSDSTTLPLAKRGDNQTPLSPTPTLQDHSTLANGECGSVHRKCVLCLELD